MTKRLAKLKFVAGSGQYGLNFPATDYVDHGIRLIRTTDLVGGTLASNENGIFVPEHAVSSGDKLLPGDLLLSRSGTIGRAFLTPSEAEGMAFAGFLVRFRPGPEVETRYLFYCTQTNDFQFAVHSDAISSTIQNFNADRYNNIKIPLPPLDEQRAIADYLDQETAQIDALVAKQEEFIGLLQERRIAAIDETFERLTTIRFPLRRALRFLTSGSRGWGDFYADEGQRFLRIGNLSRNGLSLRGRVQHVDLPDDVTEGARTSIQQGDLLFSITAYLGSVAVVDDQEWVGGYVSQHVALCRLDHKRLNPRFVGWAMLSTAGQDQLKQGAAGGTKMQLALDDIRELMVPSVSVEEQCAVSDRLDKQTCRIDTLIAKAEEHIALAKERRSALITAAVTGQFDVRTAKKGARV